MVEFRQRGQGISSLSTFSSVICSSKLFCLLDNWATGSFFPCCGLLYVLFQRC